VRNSLLTSRVLAKSDGVRSSSTPRASEATRASRLWRRRTPSSASSRSSLLPKRSEGARNDGGRECRGRPGLLWGEERRRGLYYTDGRYASVTSTMHGPLHLHVLSSSAASWRTLTISELDPDCDSWFRGSIS
jgi:hypothetical protein